MALIDPYAQIEAMRRFFLGYKVDVGRAPLLARPIW
jgi:hypothetical protein